MATLLKVLNNLADIKSAGVLHFASELRLAGPWGCLRRKLGEIALVATAEGSG